jgi:phospholipid/cholesterol/gamma-HCH transport system substrate-binding protein
METRANYVAVGAFVVVLLVAAAGVMLWLIGSQFAVKLGYFHINFEGSVAGLTKDAAVRYNGVPVGKVTDIAIDKTHPNFITVVVALSPGTVIRKDAVASLASQGLTGGSFIEISGGSLKAPVIPASDSPPGEAIPSKTSGGLQGIFDQGPEVLKHAVEIENTVQSILDENRATISDTIKNLHTITATLAAHDKDIDAILSNTAEATKNVNETVKSANKVVDKAGTLIDHADKVVGDTNTAVVHVDRLIGHADKFVDNLNGTVTDVRPGLRDFSQHGEKQLEQLIFTANDFLIKVGRVVDELERNPGKFLFGNHNEGYQPK